MTYEVVKFGVGDCQSWTPASGITPVEIQVSRYDATSMAFFKVRGIDPDWFDCERMSLWPACKMAELR